MDHPILVSACLVGLCTDWCGRGRRVPWIQRALAQGRAIAACPEQLGGLPSPRLPAERLGKRVVNAAGRDVTDNLRRGAERTLAIARAHGCRKAVLRSRSPSCGTGRIFDGTFFGTLTEGDGVAARLLTEHGLEVLSEQSSGPGVLEDE